MSQDREREILQEARLKSIRRRIEEGWADAKRGDLVDGEEFFRQLIRREKKPGDKGR